MRLALLVSATIALLSVGCSRCGSDGAVAELTAIAGDVQADDAIDPVAFTPAAVGRRFVVGEAVRTGPEASADLALAGGGTLHVDPDSVVRFARDASAADRVDVDVEQGSSTIEAPSDAPIDVETVFGTAHLDARSRTRLGPSHSRFEVIVGHATVERAGAPVVDLAVGTGIDETGATRAPAPVRTIDVRGTGGGIRLRGATDYAPLTQGRSQVSEGSTLRTDRATTIDILTADGRIRVQADSEISITAAAARAARGRFDVQGADQTRLEVPGGAIVLSDDDGPASASVEITPGEDAAVVVRSGTVLRETASGVERLVAAPLAPDPVAPTEPSPTPPTPSERAEELAAAVVLDAGETVVVHDPRAPTRTRIDAPAGCAAAQWRLDGRVQSAAAGHAALVSALRPGPHRYELRCTGSPRRTGTVRVDRERGVAAMARTAPRTVVDADGRPYSVLYQTLLPEIVLRWPHPTGAGPYTVDVQRGGASRHVSTPAASHTFASGEIGEGTSTLVFRAADGSRSPPTTLNIRFDNTTPVASIRSPEPGAALSSPVHVAGTVAEGASVSIGGTPVPVDRAARFEASVPIAADGCIAIRVALRGRATHFYLRCGGGR